ncbi:MAG: type II secretion system protein M [Candidatus Omnitrophica bacterium]|nr:type II secretion system protein M [Candidatus Omnitrophota bacterium]
MKAINNFISKRTPKEKSLLYITVAVCMVAIIYLGFINPSLNKIKELDVAINLEKESVQNDLNFVAYRSSVEAEREVISKYFTTLRDENKLNSSLQKALQDIEEETNVNLFKKNPDVPRRDEFYTEYIVNVDCVGDFKDVVAFMHKVNSSDELLTILKYRLVPKRGAQDQMTVSMTIAKMVIYPDLKQTSEMPQE